MDENQGEVIENVQSPSSSSADIVWSNVPSNSKVEKEEKVVENVRGKGGKKTVTVGDKSQMKIDGFLVNKKPGLFTATSRGLVLGPPKPQRFPGPAGALLTTTPTVIDITEEPPSTNVTGEAVQILSNKKLQRKKNSEMATNQAVSSECWIDLLTYLQLELDDEKRHNSHTNIKWIRSKDALFRSGQVAIPYLVAVVTEGLESSKYFSENYMTVEDMTGSIRVAVHEDVKKSVADLLLVGSTIFMRNVREQFVQGTCFLTMTMNNLVFICSSSKVDSTLVDHPITSRNPFPFYRRWEGSIVVQFHPWKMEELMTAAVEINIMKKSNVNSRSSKGKQTASSTDVNKVPLRPALKRVNSVTADTAMKTVSFVSPSEPLRKISSVTASEPSTTDFVFAIPSVPPKKVISAPINEPAKKLSTATTSATASEGKSKGTVSKIANEELRPAGERESKQNNGKDSSAMRSNEMVDKGVEEDEWGDDDLLSEWLEKFGDE